LPDSRLAARRLGELHYGLFASPEYLARRGIPGSPDDLSQHDLLVFTAGSHRVGWRLAQGSESRRIEAPARLRINNSFAVRDAAVQGLGIAQLPIVVANVALASRELTRVLPEWHPPAVPVHALFPSNRYLTPKVRVFIDHAVHAFSTESAD
jgi:DNA-binding transcriptional LysR family regulator